MASIPMGIELDFGAGRDAHRRVMGAPAGRRGVVLVAAQHLKTARPPLPTQGIGVSSRCQRVVTKGHDGRQSRVVRHARPAY